MTPALLASVGTSLPSLAVTVGFDRWLEFLVLVVALLLFDLLVVHRKAHVVPFKEALLWSVFWIALALLFNLWILHEYGSKPAAEFFAAYLTEKTLSVDNLFVFLVIFQFFAVPPLYRHRVLFFGILGALILRGIFIFVGLEVLRVFEPAFYFFGVLLLLTAWKLVKGQGERFDPAKSLMYRWARRLLPLVPRYEEGRFFVKEGGKRHGTTLLLVLLVIEGTDVMFALDSVPACIGISQDLFIVYTSNVFAILGLRALFFVLQGVLATIPGLQVGLSLVLAYVGVKMILLPAPLAVHVDPRLSMGIIVALLVGSWLTAAHLRRHSAPPHGGEAPADSPPYDRRP